MTSLPSRDFPNACFHRTVEATTARMISLPSRDLPNACFTAPYKNSIHQSLIIRLATYGPNTSPRPHPTLSSSPRSALKSVGRRRPSQPINGRRAWDRLPSTSIGVGARPPYVPAKRYHQGLPRFICQRLITQLGARIRRQTTTVQVGACLLPSCLLALRLDAAALATLVRPGEVENGHLEERVAGGEKKPLA